MAAQGPVAGELGEPSGPGRAAACGFADERTNQPSPLDLLESIHDRKTGAMIRVSLRLGALAAGASQGQRTALDEYGSRLGLAFQITDDLLDVRSDEAAVGKRVGKDARQGKLTFPGLLGVDRSAAYAQQLIAEACAALAPLGPAAAGLETLARYVLERNR
jgi:geranylgeranyl diphosphate synthase type II